MQPKQPKDYRHIRAWGLMMGSFEYYIKEQQEKAFADGAPLDAIYKRGGTWALYSEVESEVTRESVDQWLRGMKG